MTVTDLEVAQAVSDLYDPVVGADRTKWLHLDQGGDDDEVYWAIRLSQSGVPIVVYRGSKILVDWERDFEAFARVDKDLGLVHAGMYQGVRLSVSQAAAIIGDRPYFIGGHSLGAGRGNLAAGVGVVTGRPPLGVVLWGEPRAGGDKLVSLLGPIPVRSYWNTGVLFDDPVPDLPWDEPIPFRHAGGAVRPLIDVHEAPGGLEDAIPTAYHAFNLYLAATAKLSPMPTTGA